MSVQSPVEPEAISRRHRGSLAASASPRRSAAGTSRSRPTCTSRRSSSCSSSPACSRSLYTALRVGARLAPAAAARATSSASRTSPTCSRRSDFWKSLRNTLSIFVLSSVPQVIVAIVIAALLDQNLRAEDVLAHGRPAAVRRRPRRRRPHLRPALRRPVRPHQQLARPRSASTRSAGTSTRCRATSRSPSMVNFRWTGYNTLIFLAAMQAVPRELYEAAIIDGAGRARQFFSVTIPQIRATVIFVVITSTIGGLQIFDEPRVFDPAGAGGAVAAVDDHDAVPVRRRLGQPEQPRPRGRRRVAPVPRRSSRSAWPTSAVTNEDPPPATATPSKQRSRPRRSGTKRRGTSCMSSIPAIEQIAGRGAARAAARKPRRKVGGYDRRPGCVTYVLLGLVLVIGVLPIYYTLRARLVRHGDHRAEAAPAAAPGREPVHELHRT